MKVDGRCHCGAVVYEAVVDPNTVAICHCSDCQMLTGSAFRANISAPADTFVMRSGKPRSYIKTAQSGNKRRHAFCAECGTPIYSSDVESPRRYSLRIGCLAQRAQLQVQRQIWCDSALPWATNFDKVPRTGRQ